MKKVILLLCSFCIASFSEIIELDHFSDLRSYLSPDSIVILDIDDTLLIPVQMLGCDEWFKLRLKANGLEKALAEWEAIRHITNMELVEEGTDAIIARLQDEGFSVMGLTTQGIALATRTVQQLKGCNIDLKKNAPGRGDHFLSIGQHGALYRNGILFTSAMHKGETFFALCETLGIVPKQIVFVNDKATHLREIDTAAEIRGIPFIGLRYSYSDARKRSFDPKIADIQFRQSSFDRILSDEEALSIVEL